MRFFGLNNRKISNNKNNRIKDFLRHNKSRLIFKDDMIIDPVSLSNGISLNCSLCTRHHGCCNGSPYILNNKLAQSLIDLYPELMKYIKIKNKKAYDIILNNDSLLYDHKNIIREVRSENGKEPHCILMQDLGDFKGCLLHAYALDNNINPLTIKPPSCSLYPVDIIKTADHKYFIFAKTVNDSDDINSLSRYYESVKSEPCMSGKKSGFIVQDKIYNAFSDVLIFYIGKARYLILRDAIEGKLI